MTRAVIIPRCPYCGDPVWALNYTCAVCYDRLGDARAWHYRGCDCAVCRLRRQHPSGRARTVAPTRRGHRLEIEPGDSPREQDRRWLDEYEADHRPEEHYTA